MRGIVAGSVAALRSGPKHMLTAAPPFEAPGSELSFAVLAVGVVAGSAACLAVLARWAMAAALPPLALLGVSLTVEVGPAPRLNARASRPRLFARFGPGVERLHRRGHLRGLRAEILLVHDAIVTHDERHDARVAILRREGHKRESADPGGLVSGR